MPDTKTPKAPINGSVSEETVLKIAKEITVKFIEMGRITPASFEIAFRKIYTSISDTVRKG